MTSSVPRGAPLRAPPSGLLRCILEQDKRYGNGYVKTAITHLKTIGLLQYTTPHYKVGIPFRLFWLVGYFSCVTDWGEGGKDSTLAVSKWYYRLVVAMGDFVCLQPIKSCPYKLFTKFFKRGILKISGPPKSSGPGTKGAPWTPLQRP